MSLEIATSLDSDAGGSIRPRMTRMFTDGIQSPSFLFVNIRAIRGLTFFLP
jgi:hypothetical protein